MLPGSRLDESHVDLVNTARREDEAFARELVALLDRGLLEFELDEDGDVAVGPRVRPTAAGRKALSDSDVDNPEADAEAGISSR